MPDEAVVQAEEPAVTAEAPAETQVATEPPQTQAQETEPPQTQAPETQPPQTEPPQTEPPQTEPPQTEPPQTETQPVTEQPQTEHSYQWLSPLCFQPVHVWSTFSSGCRSSLPQAAQRCRISPSAVQVGCVKVTAKMQLLSGTYSSVTGVNFTSTTPLPALVI